jgi:RNA polymerase sigma factor (TIGR02999 family)
MAESAQAQATHLLQQWARGDRAALDRLMPLVYDELRRLAASYMRRERPSHTLQATALVNEAYLRLIDQTQVQWQNRAHFFGIAAQLMRRILVDHARSDQAAKRGGGKTQISLDNDQVLRESMIYSGEDQSLDMLALDEALEELAELDPQQGRIVELRFFGGLSIEETAEALGSSPATVKREWAMARAWLHRRLSGGAGDGPQP